MRPIAISCGEPAGIGPDIAAAAWAALRHDLPLLWIGDPRHLPKGTPWQAVEGPDQAAGPDALAVLTRDFGPPRQPGRPDPAHAPHVVAAIEEAVALVRSGACSALCTAPIHKQALIDGAMFGYGTPIGTHFAPHHPDYVDLTANSAHDPEVARALLAEAAPDGLTLRLALPPPSYARRGGEIIQAQLAVVGIEASIITMEWAQWLEQVFQGKDYDLTIVSHTEPMDIDIYARDDYYFGYDNPEFDAVIEALAETQDPDARTALFAEAQEILAEDSVNAFLFQLAKHGVWKAGIEGLWHNSPIPANDLTDVRWVN